MCKLNYASIKKFDVANSPNVGCTLFVSGCTHNCKGCFNSEAQSFTYGNEFTKEIEDLFIEYAKNPHVIHVNILGGEPFQKDIKQMTNLLSRLVSEVAKPIWLWSGYTIEQILSIPSKAHLLTYVDVLVDGRFELDKRDLSLKFRGSSNQRVIDVKATLLNNEIIIYKRGEF